MPLEIVRPTRAAGLLLLGASLLALAHAGAAQAQGPQGGTVVRGAARISGGADRTIIRQSTRRAVIDWRRFDVGRDHTVVFDQPGKTSATLNRVTTARASVIEGAIRAPGTVVIQNGAGVLFTEGATVDTGGLVATSRAVDAAGFARDGTLTLGGASAGGAVVNRGRISVTEAGIAALVGDSVANDGTIVADRGTVALAGGTRGTLDLAGDGVIRIAGAGQVENTGTLDGARVLLSVDEAASALDAAINTSGLVRARDGENGGALSLRGGGGKVRVSGTLDASGSQTGGRVTVTGRGVEVAGTARVSASGGTDGGTIRLGGGRSGTGPLPRAREIDIAAGAEVAADGTTGTGGTVIAWADANGRIEGSLSATGGQGGGFIETSARAALLLGEGASVDAGAGGAWLLDPRNVVIGTAGATPGGGAVTPPPGPGAYTVSLAALQAALDAGTDVTVTTVQPAATMAGDITVNGALTWTGAGDLTLSAERDILISAPVTTAAGDFTATAARHVSVAADIAASGAAGVTLTAGGDIRFSRVRAGDLSVRTAAGDLSLAAGGQATLRNWMGGLDIASTSGALDITAGGTILARGGAGAGQWVRVGSATSASDVTLSAPLIDVVGGIGRGSEAEILTGQGGSLTLSARDRILIQDWTGGSRARVASLDGAPLWMDGAMQCWFGTVQSGMGAADGGPVTVSGSIAATVSPIFDLTAGADFTLAPETPAGVASAYDSAIPLTVSTAGTGRVAIDAGVTASTLRLVSAEGVDLGAGTTLTTTDAGASLVVSAGRGFTNDSGADVFASGGRWLLYMDRFDSPTGTLPTSDGFDLYGRTLAADPPAALGFAGSRIVYAERPTLTLTAGSAAKTYGEAVGTPGYTASGLRAGDSFATALIGAPTVAAGGTAATANAGTYASSVSATASAQGYRLALVDGSVAVTPAPLTVTADDATRRYGVANPAFSATYAGFVLGEDAGALGGTLTLATAAATTSDVGTYAITASGLSSGNYSITYAPGTLAVTPAPLTVTARDATRRYGGANPAFSATYEGLVAGDTAADLGPLTLATAATTRSDVGSYAIAASGLSSGNYSISYAPGTLAVTPAPLTVTARDATRRYGGANPAFSASYDGLVAGDTGASLGPLTLATPATATSDVGTYTITASGLSSGNYAIAYVSGELSVTKAPLTITAADASRRYGASDPAFGARYRGFVAGDDASDLSGTLTVASGATAGSGVGAYALTPGGLTSGNYAITWRTGTLTINPAPLTITTNDSRRTYGGTGAGFTASYAGFVNGDDAGDLAGSLRFDTAATQGSPVGTYGVTPEGYANGNYAISYIAGYLTIDPAPLTVTANDATRYAGAADPDFTARYDGFVLGEGAGVLEGALDIASAADADSPAGGYALTPGGLASANYAITFVDGTLTVLPAPQAGADLLAGAGERLVATRGVPPLTPGDASFRTTRAEAPPALDNPFALTYSLGQRIELTAGPGDTAAADTAADTQGFVPASGGAGAEPGGAGAGCEGSIRTGTDAACGRRTTDENFWTSRTTL